MATGASGVAGGAQAAALVAERALCGGAQAGLEALARAALQLGDASGVRLQLGRGRSLCQAGPLPPAARETSGVQWLSAGALRLALRTPGLSPAQREQLEPLLGLAPALLAAREREAMAHAHAAGLRREVRLQAQRAARLEARRSRASHDLRTPLLVMKGYVDMIKRGMAGPVSPTLQRYTERLAAAVDEQNTLLGIHLAAERRPVGALLPPLRAALARRPGLVELRAAEPGLLLYALPSQLTLLSRTLAAAAGTAPGATLDVALEAAPRGAEGVCTVRLQLPQGGSSTVRALQRLRALATALGGELEAAPRTLSLRLPCAG